MNIDHLQEGPSGYDARVQLVTKEQLAKVLQVTPRSIDRWRSEGWLPFLRIGGRIRFDLSDVVRHLETHCRVVRRFGGQRQLFFTTDDN